MISYNVTYIYAFWTIILLWLELSSEKRTVSALENPLRTCKGVWKPIGCCRCCHKGRSGTRSSGQVWICQEKCCRNQKYVIFYIHCINTIRPVTNINECVNRKKLVLFKLRTIIDCSVFKNTNRSHLKNSKDLAKFFWHSCPVHMWASMSYKEEF